MLNDWKSRGENINEKIIRYADGEMKHVEKVKFEEELASDPGLQNQLDDYLNLLSKVDQLKNIQAEEDYFTSMIPRFRVNQARDKKLKLIPKLTLAVTFVTSIILFFTLFNYEPLNDSTVDNTLTAFSEAEIDSMLIYYPQYSTENDDEILNNENYTKYVDEIFVSELNISGEEINPTVSQLSYYTLISEINNEEADIIYDEIINKNLF